MSAGDPHVPLADQVRCVERELALRERLYPDFVARRRMTSADSKRELLRMRAVLRTLRRLVEDEARERANGGSDAMPGQGLFAEPRGDQADVRPLLGVAAAAPAAPAAAGDPRRERGGQRGAEDVATG